jgi:uncharacterized lipoprotein YddW (UPF0748 family)
VTKALLLNCLFALSVVSAIGAQTIEHRGIWLSVDQFKTPQLADTWIEKIAAAHLNAVYPLVWREGGTALFKSKFGPMAKDVPEGFDPLGYLIKIAHARGIHVHPWFITGKYGRAPVDTGVFAQHPEWRLQGGSSPWFDLGQPAVRGFLRDVMIDCLRNYDIDGLHFDYIRYEGMTVCYCDHCQREFSQKYGFRPIRPADERFPMFVHTAGKALTDRTTAQVLATFDDGKPAITTNRLDQGEAVLLNWNATISGNLAADNFAKQTLTRFGAVAKNTYQLSTTQTAARYPSHVQEKAAKWFLKIGFPAKLIDETKLAKVSPQSTLILCSQYYITEDTAKRIEGFVRAGGHCLFIDGPAFALKYPPLQQVLGFKAGALSFNEAKVITPAPGQDLVKAGPSIDVEKERERLAKWVEYRKWTVSELVRSVHRDAKALKPNVWVSAAVFYVKNSADRVCQDWYGWLREGSIDYVLPMAYTDDNVQLAKAFAEWKEADPRMERIIPGLSIYGRKDGQVVTRDQALVRSQVEMCKVNATHGNLFFCLSYLNDELVKSLAEGPYATPAKAWYPPKQVQAGSNR